MREEHAATQEIPSASSSELAWAESVHEIPRARKLPQGASFTTKLETCADSGPSGRARRRATERRYFDIYFI